MANIRYNIETKQRAKIKKEKLFYLPNRLAESLDTTFQNCKNTSIN